MECALGKSQLMLLKKSLKKRNIIANEYYKYFKNNLDPVMEKNNNNGCIIPIDLGTPSIT